MINLVSNIALVALGFLVAVTIHEFAHALIADRLGDPTPRLQGRLTLNPLAHLDPLGTILPLLLIFSGSPLVFGWGKPVQFDPYNLKNPKRDAALISLAGPVSNILLAIVLSLILRFLVIPTAPLGVLRELTFVTAALIQWNIGLAVFNLIPMHPLDGGKILIALLSQKDAIEADRFMSKYGSLLLLLLILPIWGNTAPISLVTYPIIRFLMSLLLPTNLIV